MLQCGKAGCTLLIVDSSVWIDFFRGVPTPQVVQLRGLLGAEPVGSGDLIIAEVLQGFRDQLAFQIARDALLSCEIFPMVGERIALRSAENYRALRARGVTVGRTIDCLIATFVIENGHLLLHSDADFLPFEQHLGLRTLRSPVT